MARMQILKPEEQRVFEQPPLFSSGERKRYLHLTEAARPLIETLRTPTNRVCFLVSLGYFKATRRFFARGFHKADLSYAAKQLELSVEEVNAEGYDKETFGRHRALILEHLGFEPFDLEAEARVLPDLQAMVRGQARPKRIFQHLTETLVRQRIEIPTYHTLFVLITREMQAHKASLLQTVGARLTPQQQARLDTLLEPVQAADKPVHRYMVTLLKRFSQSTRPKKIKATVTDVTHLREQYEALEHVVDALDLPHEGLRYYAQFVLNAEVFQLTRRNRNDQYLHLLAFLTHQLYRGQDVLVEILLKSVQAALNTVGREHKDKVFEHRRDQKRSLKHLVTHVQRGMKTPLDTIESIAFGEVITAEEKIARIQEVFELVNKERGAAEEELQGLDRQAQRLLRDADYYDLLEKKSRKLQNRVGDIVKFIAFEGDDAAVLRAIEHYQEKQGGVNHTAPTGFLDDRTYDALWHPDGSFRVSLYKCLLFTEVAEKLKAGTLYLRHSYKYRSLDDYLIANHKWQADRELYLHRAGLGHLREAASVIDGLARVLDAQFHLTNTHSLSGQNEHLALRKNGFTLKTPKAEGQEGESLGGLFPKGRYVALLEVLYTVNRQCGFLDAFEHWQRQRRVPRPPERPFFAGIMGYGCNIGTGKIARISRSVQAAELENTINWYFSLDNLLAANDRVLALMDSMTLPNLYRNDPEKLHTSSDGQKFEVSVESLLASHSFKYFGQGKGVSSYTFIDERNLMFYSTVISASEREAAYVIDGLMHNDVVKSDIHSTDTHGYSEIIFGVTHLLGFSFAPRIKTFSKQRLYAFEKRSSYKALGYPILPDAYIDTQLITKHWDEILRFVATIKLKEATASQLFKRLNAYSKQHPLYRALKEFGKIIKTLFMLRYMREVELRQAVEKQLNKGETGNRFDRAISFGGNQELRFAEKEEQEVADACRRLVRNAILCWNYLYLSQQLAQATPQRQKQLVEIIKHGSPVTWHHINLHGEYDFSDDKLTDSMGLATPKFIDLSHLDIWEA